MRLVHALGLIGLPLLLLLLLLPLPLLVQVSRRLCVAQTRPLCAGLPGLIELSWDIQDTGYDQFGAPHLVFVAPGTRDAAACFRELHGDCVQRGRALCAVVDDSVNYVMQASPSVANFASLSMGF